jgi:hypothetical protein
MSASVRLVCYPDGEGQFGQHAALTLRLDVPDSYSAKDVVDEIQRRLRDTYPLAAIHVESPDRDGDGNVPTWHVYRDGVTPPA